MNTVARDLSPALHIAEAKVIEWASAPSFAEFLMVLPLPSEAFSLNTYALLLGFEEEFG